MVQSLMVMGEECCFPGQNYPHFVIPAQAGIHAFRVLLNPGFPPARE
jgi:hypothetical protein